jgi:hypothetical protein
MFAKHILSVGTNYHHLTPDQGNRILSELGAMVAVSRAKAWLICIGNRVVEPRHFDEFAFDAIALDPRHFFLVSLYAAWFDWL